MEQMRLIARKTEKGLEYRDNKYKKTIEKYPEVLTMVKKMKVGEELWEFIPPPLGGAGGFVVIKIVDRVDVIISFNMK